MFQITHVFHPEWGHHNGKRTIATDFVHACVPRLSHRSGSKVDWWHLPSLCLWCLPMLLLLLLPLPQWRWWPTWSHNTKFVFYQKHSESDRDTSRRAICVRAPVPRCRGMLTCHVHASRQVCICARIRGRTVPIHCGICLSAGSLVSELFSTRAWLRCSGCFTRVWGRAWVTSNLSSIHLPKVHHHHSHQTASLSDDIRSHSSLVHATFVANCQFPVFQTEF